MTDSIVARHSLGDMIKSPCGNQANGLVYVAGLYHVRVAAPDGTAIVADIQTGAHAPWATVAVPYPNKVYVGDFNGFGTTVIDGNTSMVTDTLPTSAVDSYGDTVRGKVYTLGQHPVHVYDPWSDSLAATVQCGSKLE
jgi:hypothetical protein